MADALDRHPWPLRLASILLVFGLWEWAGRIPVSLAFPTFSATLAAFAEMAADGTFLSAYAETVQPLLVVALAHGGRDVAVDEALTCVYGYAVGLDMTRRDLQATAKKMGRPWDTAKGFDPPAPIGPIVPARQIGHPDRGAIWLEVDGVRRQDGDLAQQIWKLPETLAYLSTLVELAPGDLIMTGTPSGVGPVDRNAHLRGYIEGLGELEVRYAPR